MPSRIRKAVIITALPVEREAVLEHLREVREVPHPQGSIYHQGTFDDNSDPWDVLVAEIGLGNEAAAAEVERAANFHHPEVALFVGVAGAIKDFNRGDVVASSKVYNYESGKERETGFEQRPDIELPAYKLLQRARFEARDVRWRRRIKRGGAQTVPLPAAGVGPIASGPKVLTTTRSTVYAFIRQNYGDAVAVEMEGYGFLRGVWMNHPVLGLVLRGISDHLDDKTPQADKDWQPMAARHAAAFAFQLLGTLDATSIGDGGRGSPEVGDERLRKLDWVRRASIARCVERWQALGVGREDARELANDPTVGAAVTRELPSTERPLRIVTGALGVGKSLRSERWHQQNIKTAFDSPEAPVPVYIEVNAATTDLVTEIDRLTDGLGDWRTCGVALALDRLERAGPGGAESLLRDARRLITTYPRSAVLLTSRPFPHLEVEEAVSAAALGEAEAVALVSRFAGRTIHPYAIHEWPQPLRSAIRQPLFAILIGIDLANQPHRSHPLGGLLGRLVQRALGDTGGPDKPLLRRLAVTCVDTGYGSVRAADIGGPPVVGRLLSSSLVVPRNGTLNFSLDILTDWFAAEALAEGDVDIEDIVSNVSRLERWRYPLIIAAGLFSHELVSRLLSPLAARRPAFCSHVVDEAMTSYAFPGDPDPPAAPPPMESGEKIREAMMAWATGLGQLAKVVAPVDSQGQLLPVSVRSSGSGLTVAWGSMESLVDVSELPPNLKLREADMRFGWKWARPASVSAWAWSWTLEDLSRPLTILVQRCQLPLLVGPLLDEEVWHEAVILDRRKSGLLPSCIPLRGLRESIRPYGAHRQLAHWDGRSYDFVSLRERLEALDATGAEYLASPWPAPDHPERPVRFLWNGYSTERLHERTRAVLEGALAAYQQLVETHFQKFKEHLPLAGLLPLRLVLRFLSTDDPMAADRSPFVEWYFEPLAYGQTSHVSMSVGATTVAEIESKLARLSHQVRTLRPDRWRWLRVSMHRGGIDVFGDRSATALAYRWLTDDLKAVRWLH
jgi:nucleoside phosphorylase